LRNFSPQSRKTTEEADMRSDEPHRTFEIERVQERIAALESDRAALMRAIRGMREGKLDDRYLTDTVRAELARSSSYGVLLEALEVEISCLRQGLAEMQAA
jgi:hypothetical protein